MLPNDPVAVGQQLPNLPPGAKLPELKLWGLTLGFAMSLHSGQRLPTRADLRSERRSMTLDFVSHMTHLAAPSDLSTYPYAVAALDTPLHGATAADKDAQSKATSDLAPFAPAEASIFPRFVRPRSLALPHPLELSH